MSANLSAAAKEIRRNPWRLMHRPTDAQSEQETFYDAVRAFGEGAGQLRDAIARLDALSKSQEEISSADPTLKQVLASLQTSFEKFGRAETALWEKMSGRPLKLPAGGPAD